MGNPPSQDTLWSLPGEGVLARQGGLVLLTGIDDGEFADSLLDLLGRVSADGGDGRALADAVGARLEEHRSWGGPEAGPAVVSFGPAGNGMAFSVSGRASVDLSTAHGDEWLTAVHPSMVLKTTVGMPVRSVRAALDRDEPGSEADRFSRLDSGTVRAAGLSYYPPGDRPGRPADGPGPDDTDPSLAVPEEYGFSPNTLVGTVIPLRPRVAGQPLGELILDDGTALPVEGAYVIGRDPDQDQSVAAGAARPLRITDAKQTVSRVHARVQVDGDQVLITDLGSANGTHVQPRDAPMPLLLEPRVPVPIQPGTRIFVGAPYLRYERSDDGNRAEKGL